MPTTARLENAAGLGGVREGVLASFNEDNATGGVKKTDTFSSLNIFLKFQLLTSHSYLRDPNFRVSVDHAPRSVLTCAATLGLRLIQITAPAG
jgi:hypothetical protein